jgi:hypothetical protein
VRRPSLPRPSAATVISLVALFFAMGGTAYAATGGNFILGRSNTASHVSSLTNTKGTALNLSSASTRPPLTVSNSVQVPNLNASELGGTAATGFMQGSGQVHAGWDQQSSGLAVITSTPGSTLIGVCGPTGGFLRLDHTSGHVVWWNANGVGSSSASSVQVTPQTTQDLVVVLQATEGVSVSSYTATQTFDPATEICTFTAQVVTGKG